MRRIDSLRPFPRAIGPLVAALLMLALPARAVVKTWPNAVNGSASTASNWSPAIVPNAADDASFQTAGNYTVSWASPQDTLAYLHAIIGTPAFSISNNLGVLNIFSLGGGGRLTVAAGRVRSNMLAVGSAGFGRLIVTGAGSQVVSRSPNAATMFAETTSTSAALHVLAEAQLLSNSWIETARKTASTCSVTVSGGNLITKAGSKMGTMGTSVGTQRGNVIVSVFGSTKFDISNGGFLDVKGHLVVGQRGSALMRMFDTSVVLDPAISVAGTTFIGYESSALTAGTGTLSIEGGTARLGGGVQIGDPDHTSGNGDFGDLRILGGRTIVGGTGIQMPTSLAGSLEMIGGTLQLLAGATTLRQTANLNISSGIGSPTLLLNGTASATTFLGSPGVALGVGRGGAGRLRVVGPVASFTANGTCEIADSVGGSGVVEVDSAGTLSCATSVHVGDGGSLSLLGGSNLFIQRSSGFVTFTSSGAVTMAGGMIDTDLGYLDAPGTLTGSGTLQYHWQNSGNIVIPAAETLYVTGGLEHFPGSITGGGVLKVGMGLIATGTLGVDVIDGASLAPYHTVALDATRRTRPGAAWARPRAGSPARVADAPLGSLRITGNLDQSGRVYLRLGSERGARDTLQVDGTATIAGDLQIDADPATQWLPGDTVTVLTAGNVVGTFSSVTFEGETADSLVHMIYEPTAVKAVLVRGTSGVGRGPLPGNVGSLRFRAELHHGATAFVVELPVAARVRLVLHDVNGRAVARLVDGPQTAGRREFRAPDGLASGMYFARLEIVRDGPPIVMTARAPILR